MNFTIARPVATLATATAAATGIPGWFVAGSIWTGAGLIAIIVGVGLVAVASVAFTHFFLDAIKVAVARLGGGA